MLLLTLIVIYLLGWNTSTESLS